jgi:uncharacterized membrane protein
MLHDIIAISPAGERILAIIEYIALVIEILAVVIIVVAIFHAMFRYTFRSITEPQEEDHYQELKIRLGKALLLGLEILVAADIIRTVALEATLESVLILGLLVLIRTFLSWALVVEIEGRWPWNAPKQDGNAQGEEI